MAVFFLIIYGCQDPTPAYQVWINLIQIGFILGGCLFLKLNGSIFITANLITCGCYINAFVSCFYEGGLMASGVVWFVFLQMVPGFMSEGKSGFFWSVISVLMVICFYVTGGGGELLLFRALENIAVILVVGWGFRYYERFQEFTLETLEQSRMRAVEHSQSMAELTIQLQEDILKRKKIEVSLREHQEKLKQLSVSDPLTGIMNRRHFFDLVEQHLDHAVQYKLSLSIIMIDVDFFKKINDGYGHVLGDSVLVAIAKECTATLRQSDLVARFGGEEFTLFLPETPVEEAFQISERLRKQIESLGFDVDETSFSVTISSGIYGAVPHAGETVTSLIDKADKALYLSKNNGRNRSSVWEADPGKSYSQNLC